MADITSVYILPHHLFDVVKSDDGLLQFVPKKFVYHLLQTLIGCKVVRLHSYIKRHIKQIGIKDSIVLIPRIQTLGDRRLTHVLLPEFILPYCRYTVKYLPLVFENDIPYETRIDIGIKQWDKYANITSRVSVQKTIYYLKSRYHQLQKRFKQLSLSMVKTIAKPLSIISKHHLPIAKYYLLKDQFSLINVLRYSDHIVSEFDSS